MKISELIAAVGDENVMMQTLDSDVTDIRTSKGHSLVTFGTNTVSPSDFALPAKERSLQGIVVWLPRKKVAEVIAKASN